MLNNTKKYNDMTNAVKIFKSESNKKIELSYLKFLTKNYKTKLFFTNSTSTDGSNIYIYVDHPYIINPKNNALEKTFEELQFDKKYLDNKFTLLKLHCRGNLVHEAGHILFNDFELLNKAKKDYDRKDYKYFHELLNIVLDANMELSMINYYEGVREYLEFNNCLAYHNLNSVEEYEENSSSLLSTYYYWAMFYTIMGREKGEVKNPKIVECIEKTKPLLTKARFERNMNTKYYLIKEIFEIIKPLIEEDNKQNTDFDFNLSNFLPENTQIWPNNNSNEVNSQDVQINIDFKTSENKPENNNQKNSQNNQSESSKNEEKAVNATNNNQISFGLEDESEEEKGKAVNETDDKQMSFGLDNNNEDNDDNSNEQSNSSSEEDEISIEEDNKKRQEFIEEIMETLTKDLEKVEKLEEKREKEEEKEKQNKEQHMKSLNNLDYNEINKKMKVYEVEASKTNNFDVGEYNSLYETLKPEIKSFTKKLLKILKEQKEDYETKLISGSRIDMKRIYDKKDLIWKSKKDNKEFADLTISVYVDGSQSMGNKLTYVRKSLIMLHSACVELNIPLTVVEGRALFRKNQVQHKVLCNFSNYKKEDTKYNMVKIEASDNTREGISLKWVNEYHKLQSPTSDKLLIVLSDGEPYHNSYSDVYFGEGMIKDCKDTFKKIRKDSVVMPIALGSGVYPRLTEIYPKVINCEEEHFNKLGDILCKQIKKNLYKK